MVEEADFPDGAAGEVDLGRGEAFRGAQAPLRQCRWEEALAFVSRPAARCTHGEVAGRQRPRDPMTLCPRRF